MNNERVKGGNPARGVKVAAKSDAAGERRPYSEGHAAVILRAARRERGARRWVPWLLAFTGARMEEVCQSLASDVRQEGDIWYLDINEDGPGKSLKNQGSARRVPLHPKLLAEGFPEYVAKRPSDGPLFPGLTPDRFGKKGGNFSKWYGRWQRTLGITDRRLVAHSRRHRFKDVCRDAGLEEAVHDALTGQAPRTVRGRYGRGYPLTSLAEAVSRLPALDLDVASDKRVMAG